LTQDSLIKSFAMRNRIIRACFSLDGAATRAAESREGAMSTMVVTVKDTLSRGFAHIFRFHLANCEIPIDGVRKLLSLGLADTGCPCLVAKSEREAKNRLLERKTWLSISGCPADQRRPHWLQSRVCRLHWTKRSGARWRRRHRRRRQRKRRPPVSTYTGSSEGAACKTHRLSLSSINYADRMGGANGDLDFPS
jgi:hypothetical protein